MALISAKNFFFIVDCSFFDLDIIQKAAAPSGAAAQAVQNVRRTFPTPSQYLDFLAALLPENLPLRGANACWRRLFSGI
ncbi:hypothetical protein [Dysosmobacter sp.]|uniref:hypothetical protein n=1 Tax=Dysosmobacter sp. TaxID=2591382 RepID=UPI002A88EAE9|nr:hypothetical protein [Dysosmobacter sp.]MDY3984045.1 hypothetical protein [Dysosmobacter sp.]